MHKKDAAEITPDIPLVTFVPQPGLYLGLDEETLNDIVTHYHDSGRVDSKFPQAIEDAFGVQALEEIAEYLEELGYGMSEYSVNVIANVTLSTTVSVRATSEDAAMDNVLDSIQFHVTAEADCGYDDNLSTSYVEVDDIDVEVDSVDEV